MPFVFKAKGKDMQRHDPAHPATTFPPNLLIVTEAEAARMLRLSVRTLQRLRVEGGGPRYVQLTTRRIGYSVSAVEAWIERREAASTSAATVANGRAA